MVLSLFGRKSDLDNKITEIEQFIKNEHAKYKEIAKCGDIKDFAITGLNIEYNAGGLFYGMGPTFAFTLNDVSLTMFSVSFLFLNSFLSDSNKLFTSEIK
jgi:hypothetical protein